METKTVNQNEFKEAIAKTIAFFDVFDFPPTDLELWKYCSHTCNLPDIREFTLQSNTEKEKGFYYLSSRKHIVKTRADRYIATKEKVKRARAVARLFKFLPWIEMIALGNIVGANNLKPQGDIDLFIITAPKRIWLTRFFCAGLMQVLRLRPRPGKKKNKICLSFYLSRDNLNLVPYMLDNNDIYFKYWLLGLVPIFDQNNIYKELLTANPWLKREFPNWQSFAPSQTEISPIKSSFYKETLDILLAGFETLTKFIQLKILPKNIKEIVNQDTRAVMNDQVLRMYVNDRREYYRGQYAKNLEKVKFPSIKEHHIDFRPYKNLERFSDGRINYSGFDTAPIILCFVKHQDEILILKRSLMIANYPRTWNTVSGYIDEPVSLEAKAREELREEIGLDLSLIESIKVGKINTYFDKKINKTWIIYPIIVVLKARPKIQLDWEHSEYKWIKPKELKYYEIVPNLIKILGYEMHEKNK
ncbi:NUDIX domain-containing protein [Candidatus Parcubacteria bacterium]|nr:NUDIX domain-containing protein [Candidatus Parcubacteria bacterium]